MAFQPWLSDLAYGQGRRSRCKEYDHLGNVVETKTYVSQAAYEANEANYLTITETLYDEFARPIVTTDTHEKGATNVPGTETIYDALGRVIQTKRWADVTIPIVDMLDDSNNVIGRTNTLTDNNDPNWSRGLPLSVSKSYYNKAGRLWMSETQDENGQDQPTYYEYDGAGRQTAVIDALDNRTEYGYLGNRRTSITDALGHITQFKHDDLGRVKRTTYHDNTSTHSHYDELGRMFASNDQTGRTRRFEHSKNGQLSAVVLPAVANPEDGNNLAHPRYEYTYDTYGNSIAQTDKLAQDPNTGDVDANYARTTYFTYDYLGNQLTRKLPNGKVEYKEYNTLGQLTKATDFKRQIVRYEYGGPNAPGALSKEKYYASASVDINEPNLVLELSHDKLGRRTAVDVNDQGQTCVYSYDYDAHGRIEYIFTPEGSIRYEYSDITGQRRSVYTPAGTADTQVDYYYDELGRLAEVEAAQLNGQDANDIAAYTYNAVGSLETVQYPNGNLAQYTYDTLNRLTTLTNWQTSAKATALSSYQYTLAPDGQRTSVTETAGAQQTVVTWDYDNLSRLVLEDYNAPGDTNDFLHDYVYDLVGNRTKKTVDGSTVTTYSYNNADQLTQEITDSNSIVYSYDDNGALTFKDSDTDPNVTYGYNLRGRLAQVDIENGATVEYLYNADGLRVRSVVDGNATDYVIDPHNHTGYAQVLKEVGDANTVYVTGLDALAQVTGASAPQYLLYDGHSSVRALANNVGSVVERYNYEAYGTLHKFTGTPATNLLYSGEWRDQHTGLDNLRSRWYNPTIGRFNRMDEFAGNNRDPQSLHKYLYAHCNPINNADPSGNTTLSETLTAVGQVVMFAGWMVLTFKAGRIWYKLTSLEEQLVDEAFLEAEDLALEVGIDLALMLATAGIGSLVRRFGPGLLRGVKRLAALRRFKRNIKFGAKAEQFILGAVQKKKAFKTALGVVIPDKVTTTTIKEIKNVKYLTKSKQMRKMVALAKGADDAYGEPTRKLILHVREDTKISKPLMELFEELKEEGLFKMVRDVPMSLAP
jgi:RHS repeat-associated protein